MQWLLGVDEAGRGPLAGPVAVGVACVPAGFDVVREFPGVADSKQLSEGKREEIFALLEQRTKAGDVRFCVRFGSNKAIDSKGIVPIVRAAVYAGIRELAPAPVGARVLLDGLLAAPPEYEQETIIGGDGSEPVISLASIAAKVVRDRRMRALGERHPEYGFARHKGYGTAFHYEMLAKHGPCIIHRRTYLHLDERAVKA